jgi:hypothetical protein
VKEAQFSLALANQHAKHAFFDAGELMHAVASVSGREPKTQTTGICQERFHRGKNHRLRNDPARVIALHHEGEGGEGKLHLVMR